MDGGRERFSFEMGVGVEYGSDLVAGQFTPGLAVESTVGLVVLPLEERNNLEQAMLAGKVSVLGGTDLGAFLGTTWQIGFPSFRRVCAEELDLFKALRALAASPS